MKNNRKALVLLFTSFCILVAFAIFLSIEKKQYSLLGGNKYENMIVENVQKVADSTTYFIEVFPFDSIEYHEIPTLFIYQEGKLRKYASYKDTNYYFLKDAKGYFSINKSDTSIIKPYKQAYEIDVFSTKSNATIDGLLWDNFTFMTEGVGYIHVFDLNNSILDSILYTESNTIKKNSYQNLFTEYKIRPYRIFYTDKTDYRNINKDVSKTFDELVSLFQTQKCIKTTSLSYSTFLPDSEMIKNEYYTISFDRPYTFGSPNCDLPLASYAKPTVYNKKIIEKEPDESLQWLMMESILLDSIGTGRCKFEHSVFQPISYPTKRKYEIYGKGIKENPCNKFYQYITIHKDNYDVMYVLSDEHFYHLDCWNEGSLRKKCKILDNCLIICFFGGLILLIISIFLFRAGKKV